MSDQLPIVCPSKGRAGRVSSLELFPDLIFFVHESEAGDYRTAYPDSKVETHDVLGLARIRNAICDRFGDVFMVDDDITRMLSMWQAPGEARIVADAQLARKVIARSYAEAQEAGCHLFGYARNLNPMIYRAAHPIHLTGLIGEHAFGVIPTPELRWNPNIVAATDYWICALNAYLYRIMWIDMRWSIGQAGTMAATGGLSSARTLEVEREDNALLRSTFGAQVFPPKRHSIVARQKNDSQRRLVIPW